MASTSPRWRWRWRWRRKDRPTNETLDFIADKLKVVEVHRPKKSCVRRGVRLLDGPLVLLTCERMVQTPASPRTIKRGMAGPALLAHILGAKYGGQFLLHRQSETFARMGAYTIRIGTDWRAPAKANGRQPETPFECWSE